MAHEESHMKLAPLGHDNYYTWSNKIKSVLQYRGLWPAVLGEADITPEVETKAAAFIKFNVEDWLLPTVQDLSARLAWQALKARNESTTNARMVSLKSKLSALKMEPAEPLTKYIGRAQTLMVEMTAIGLTVTEADITLAVLHGLPTSYAVVRTIIETTNVELTIDTLFNKLLSVEQNLSSRKEEHALFANGRGTPHNHRGGHHGSNNGRHDGQPTHGGRGYDGKSANRRPVSSSDPCYYCGKPGHFKSECRSFANDKREGKVHPDKASSSNANGGRIGGAASSNGNNASNGNHGSGGNFAFMALKSVPFTPDWTMDSGASTHMTMQLDDFIEPPSDLHPFVNVTFGNGKTGVATARGTAIVRTMVDGKVNALHLTDTLYVPELSCKLLSVKRLTMHGASVTFNADNAHVLFNGDTIAVANAYPDHGLFMVKPIAETAFNATTKLKETPALWHNRYCHLSYDNVTNTAMFNFNLDESEDELFNTIDAPTTDPVPAPPPVVPPSEEADSDNDSEGAAAPVGAVPPPNTGRPVRDRRPPQGIYANNWAPQAHVAVITPPLTYEEAMARDDADLWRLATDDEVKSLLGANTYSLERLPPGFKALPCKWVFTVKRDAHGNIERYKARLVVKGFLQREGIDYTEVFAPVSKHATLRALMATVAVNDLILKQLDVKTAFLNGDLEETIYMRQPPGYEEGGVGIACRLRKSLYGLKQAPRAWNTKLNKELITMGFNPSNADPSLYSRHDKNGTIFVLVYVDDILVAGKDTTSVDTVIQAFQALFDVRDLGEADFFLGMDIHRDRTNKTLKIGQHRLVSELVDKYGLGECKGKTIPLSPSSKLTKTGEPLDRDKFGYSELIGSLLYISVCTRPDIAQAVGALTRYMAHPTVTHWQAAKGVVRYLACTIDFGIMYGISGNTGLKAFTDSDFAGDPDTRRSTTGNIFTLHGGAISWSSRLQKTVAVSTTEAEYMASAAAVKEALWLRGLLADFNFKMDAIKIYGDNQAAIHLLKNANASARSKHIDVVHHFARERVMRNEVTFEYLPTHLMIADCMTKAVPESKFLFCRNGMGVC